MANAEDVARLRQGVAVWNAWRAHRESPDGAHLYWAADLSEADLSGMDLRWNLKLKRAKQRDLVITSFGQHKITVDNLEIGQFVSKMVVFETMGWLN